MSTPSITLTATLQDFTGAAIGAVGYPARMCIALCGFGAQLPRVGGTSLLAQVVKTIESTSGLFSTKLWGNDVITPSATYYAISLIDTQGNVVQCGQYSLTGSGTFDLSSLTPILTPGQGSGAVPAPLNIAGAPGFQICTGTVDGTNRAFTFTAQASPQPVIEVFAGGIYMTPGISNDYPTPVYLGSQIWQITFNVAPVLGPVSVIVLQQVGQGSRTVTSAPTVSVTGGNQDNTIFCNFSVAQAITIPNASTAGISYQLTFKDISGAAATHPITINCGGGIEAGTSYTISINMGAVTLRSDGNVWRAISKF